MAEHFDVVIIGGAATGSACAYFLTANPDFDGNVAIIERDPTFATAATSLSSSSIRQQFSNEVNVKIGIFGAQFIREFDNAMAIGDDRPNIEFHEDGYLFLAANDDQAQILRENHKVQVACGADIELLDAQQTKEAFPHLNVYDLQLASYGRSGEGWFSNTALMHGFRKKAIAQGAQYLIDEVVAMEQKAGRITAVELASGKRIGCGAVVNCSGTSGARIASMAGLELPVEPRKRTLFVFTCAQSPQGKACVNGGRLPLMIDSSGVFCRPEGGCFLAGNAPDPDPAVALDDYDPQHDEFEKIWVALAERAECFETIRLVNFWAGHYDYNVLDQNAILGTHHEVENFIFVNGFSGHGLQQAPAMGRGVSELLIYEEFRTLDLRPLSYERIVRGEIFPEKATI